LMGDRGMASPSWSAEAGRKRITRNGPFIPGSEHSEY
jgi:hypothetical protein